jgi:hypothetical protein
MAVRFELLGVVPDTGTIPKMTSRYYRFLTSRVPRRKERKESCRLAGSDAFKAKRRGAASRNDASICWRRPYPPL